MDEHQCHLGKLSLRVCQIQLLQEQDKHIRQRQLLPDLHYSQQTQQMLHDTCIQTRKRSLEIVSTEVSENIEYVLVYCNFAGMGTISRELSIF